MCACVHVCVCVPSMQALIECVTQIEEEQEQSSELCQLN